MCEGLSAWRWMLRRDNRFEEGVWGFGGLDDVGRRREKKGW